MLHFVERGRGPAIVFVHAFPMDHSMWETQINLFSERWRVVAPDVIGFGGSTPARPWTMEDMGRELLALFDHLKIDRCTLAGLSMGGYISLQFTAEHPERVERLILAHSRVRADNDAEKKARSDMIAAIRQGGVETLPERMLPRLLAANAPADVREKVRQKILSTDPQAAAFAVEAMRNRKDASGLPNRISCPALILAGDQDVILTVEDCCSVADSFPKGQLAVIPNAGHLSNVENPEAFNAAVLQFLEST